MSSLIALILIISIVAYFFFAGFWGSWPQIVRKLSKQKYDDCDEYEFDQNQLPNIKDLEATGILHIVVGLNTTSKDKSFLSKHHSKKDAQAQTRTLLNYWAEKTINKLGCTGGDGGSGGDGGGGGTGWDGKPWVYNGNDQNVKDYLAILNKWIKTLPKPKTCIEASKNMLGLATDVRNLMTSESFPKTPSERTEFMFTIGTIIDPSWETKYTKYNAPDHTPTTPELEFYGLNKYNTSDALYLNELDCKKMGTGGVEIAIPKSTDAQATDATEILTTVKKLDANNVNCADAQLTFAMFSLLLNQPGVVDLNPDLAYAIWTPDAQPVLQKCNIELG
jgi:hypothetical protein